MRRLVMATTVLWLACGSGELDGQRAGSASGGDTLGGDGQNGLACQVISTTPVAWTDATALGSPDVLFAPFEGTCQASFRWDARAWSGVTVTPVRGESVLSVTVLVERASARWVARTGVCGDSVEADATVTLTLPEGQVADAKPVTLSASSQATPMTTSFTLNEESFGAWLSIQKSNPAATLAMTVQVGAPALGCSGAIQLSQQVVASGRGEAMGGPLASWTDSGCPVGQGKVDLDQPGQGRDVASAIATDFGRISLSGTWADGTASTLTLTTSPSVAIACVEARAGTSTVIVPVDLVARTDDGRITSLSAKGNVRATLAQGALTDLQLGLSADLTCESALDVLSYAAADCATVDKVTVQLLANRYPANPSANSTRLDFYIYDRQGGSTGAANKVDSFLVGP